MEFYIYNFYLRFIIPVFSKKEYVIHPSEMIKKEFEKKKS